MESPLLGSQFPGPPPDPIVSVLDPLAIISEPVLLVTSCTEYGAPLGAHWLVVHPGLAETVMVAVPPPEVTVPEK